jgi:hypothetical protein
MARRSTLFVASLKLSSGWDGMLDGLGAVCERFDDQLGRGLGSVVRTGDGATLHSMLGAAHCAPELKLAIA